VKDIAIDWLTQKFLAWLGLLSLIVVSVVASPPAVAQSSAQTASLSKESVGAPLSDLARQNMERVDFLNVERMLLPNQLQEKVLPAGKPKLRRLAKLARSIGWNIRRLGFPGIVGRVKDSPLLTRLLYSSNGTNGMHPMPFGAQAYLREIFAPEVQRLDELLLTNLSVRWGYSKTV
jgi:hypothetical protein